MYGTKLPSISGPASYNYSVWYIIKLLFNVKMFLMSHYEYLPQYNNYNIKT